MRKKSRSRHGARAHEPPTATRKRPGTHAATARGGIHARKKAQRRVRVSGTRMTARGLMCLAAWSEPLYQKLVLNTGFRADTFSQPTAPGGAARTDRFRDPGSP